MNMSTVFNNKNIESELGEIKFDITNKMMKREGKKYFSYIISSFNGKYLVPIDCPLFISNEIGQPTIDDIIEDVIEKANDDGSAFIYKELINNSISYEIRVKDVVIEKTISVGFLDKTETINALDNTEIMKLRSSDEITTLLNEEIKDIATAIKKAEYDSIENPFTKWWMDQDNNKIARSFGI